MSSTHTGAQQEIRGIQGFLAARGHRIGLTGVFCRQTVTAVQTYLRDSVDRSVRVDGVCGPHTGRVLETVKDDIQRRCPPRSGRGTRLVMHTSSRKKSDYYTFEAEAMRIEAEYKRAFPNDVVRRVLVRTGKEIAQIINACEVGSIVSWDVLSHSNAGGIHISTDLAQPVAASADQQRRHLQQRSQGRNAQSAKDALFMEEDMRGLYTSAATTRLVADYFNQQPTGYAATLEEVRTDRFSSECYVELHGCRTVNDEAAQGDLFIGNLSARLPCDATVVGHTGGSYPQGARGYRHGEVGVFRGGQEIHRGRRESLKLPNASTPGQDDERFDGTTVPQRGSNGGSPRSSTTGERRDFKTDWPRTGTPTTYPPGDNNPPRTGTPHTYPPGRDNNPPNSGTPHTYPPGRDDNPPNSGTPGTYPPGTYPPGTYPPGDNNPPNSGRPGTYPPSDNNPPNSGRPGTYPPPQDNNPPNSGTPGTSPPRQGADVPWAAILTGVAVVGGIALEARRDRDARRDPRGSTGGQSPRTPTTTPTTPRETRIPGSNGMERYLGAIDRGNPVGSITRGLTSGLGRR